MLVAFVFFWNHQTLRATVLTPAALSSLRARSAAGVASESFSHGVSDTPLYGGVANDIEANAVSKPSWMILFVFISVEQVYDNCNAKRR